MTDKKTKEEVNTRKKLRERYKDYPQFIYWDECKVIDWFYKGQTVWIEDIRDTIPEGNPNPDDKEFFISYQCRVGNIDAYILRIIEGKYLVKNV